MKLKELDEVIANQNRKIDDLVEMMGMVVSEMTAKKQEEVKVNVNVTEDGRTIGTVSKTVQLPPEVSGGLPPPSKWRAKVDELLGPDFDMQVEETSGGNYTMKVLLPVHLDRRNGDEKGKGRDVSSGFIRRASDVADVEKWALLIKANIQKKFPDFKKV